MKTIFRILVFLFLVNSVKAQIINFPDVNFKNNLLYSTNYNIARDINGATIVVDTNADGQIQESEALLVYELNFTQGFQMTDLTGLSYFINLRKFFYIANTSVNSFSQLNLSGFNNLTTVDCWNNIQLLDVTLTNLPLLTHVDLHGSKITTVNLSNLPSINQLSFNNSELTNLNMNNCHSLTNLNLAQSKIVNVDLSGYSNLNLITLFSCHFIQYIDLSGTNISQFGWTTLSNNPIPFLRLNNCLNLSTFSQGDTKFGIVEMINCPSLQQVSFQGTVQQIQSNLTSLDLSGALNLNSFKGNFPSLQYLYMKDVNNVATLLNFNSNPSIGVAFNNANLDYVCVNEDQVVPVDDVFSNASYPDAVVGSYCSFVPSPTYNTIAGIAKLDSDSNGCDSNDSAMRNLKIKKTQLTNDTFTFTNNTGNYNFYTTVATNQDIEPTLENPTYFNVNPGTATITIPSIDGSTITQDFCISPNGIHNDLEVVIAPITQAQPGFDATYQIVYKNKGNQTLSGNVHLTFDDDKMDFVSAIPNPDNLAVNALSWNYTNLLPFESRTINVTLNVNSPQETPAVNIGDQLDFEVVINPIVNDEIPLDNSFTYNQIVVGSFDPNTIECLEGEVVAPSYIGQYLHYAVNFENTGNYPAENIVVKIVVDTTKYDMNSLQLLNVSHNSYTRVSGNIIEIIFQEINLDSGGHGNLLFKIRTNGNLVVGNAVAKRADIFFDYNAPIDTGMANTTFEVLSNSVFELDDSISISPNPTKGMININCNNTIKSVELYDVQGRLLQSQLLDEVQTSIDLTEQSNGIYFLKITSDKGSKVEKLIKE